MAKTKRTFRKINKRKNNKSKRRVSKRNNHKMKGGRGPRYFGTTTSDYISYNSGSDEPYRGFDDCFANETNNFFARYARYSDLMRYLTNVVRINEFKEEIFRIIPYYGLSYSDGKVFNSTLGYQLNNKDYWTKKGEGETYEKVMATLEGTLPSSIESVQSGQNKRRKIVSEQPVSGSPSEVELAIIDWLKILKKEEKLQKYVEENRYDLRKLRNREQLANYLFGKNVIMQDVSKAQLLENIVNTQGRVDQDLLNDPTLNTITSFNRNTNLVNLRETIMMKPLFIEVFNDRFSADETISYNDFFNFCIYGD